MKLLLVETKIGVLLIPVSMVAQILPSNTRVPMQHKAHYVSYEIAFREFTVPLIHSTEAFGGASFKEDDYQHVVVLWPLKDHQNESLFSFSSLSSPRIAEVDSVGELQYAKQSGNFFFTLGIVQFGDQRGIIPDLRAIASELFIY